MDPGALEAGREAETMVCEACCLLAGEVHCLLHSLLLLTDALYRGRGWRSLGITSPLRASTSNASPLGANLPHRDEGLLASSSWNTHCEHCRGRASVGNSRNKASF